MFYIVFIPKIGRTSFIFIFIAIYDIFYNTIYDKLYINLYRIIFTMYNIVLTFIKLFYYDS